MLLCQLSDQLENYADPHQCNFILCVFPWFHKIVVVSPSAALEGYKLYRGGKKLGETGCGCKTLFASCNSLFFVLELEFSNFYTKYTHFSSTNGTSSNFCKITTYLMSLYRIHCVPFSQSTICGCPMEVYEIIKKKLLVE